jgi:hypothetical protein
MFSVGDYGQEGKIIVWNVRKFQIIHSYTVKNDSSCIYNGLATLYYRNEILVGESHGYVKVMSLGPSS